MRIGCSIRWTSRFSISCAKLLRSFRNRLRKVRTWLEQDLERESRGAAGRKQMARLPEVCIRFGQIRCFGLAEAKLFELIDPPQEALVVRIRLKSLTTRCSAVPHISPRRA
jgi:hypothetical protein